jgi:hypothetical protein
LSEVADVNQDGFLDLIVQGLVPNTSVYGVGVALAVGGLSWTFAPATMFGGPMPATGGFPVVHDFDQDGVVELVISGPLVVNGPEFLRLYKWSQALNDYYLHATYPTSVGPPVGLYPATIATLTAGDFNGDGNGDLALSVRAALNSSFFPTGPTQLELLAGDGALGFAPPVTTTLPIVVNTPAHQYYYALRTAPAADVNGDGVDDWVGIAYDHSASPIGGVYVALGGATGFQTPTLSTYSGADYFQWAGGLNRPQLVDFDLDGHQELLGNFAAVRLWPPGATTTALDVISGGIVYSGLAGAIGYYAQQVAADFDNDGDPDVWNFRRVLHSSGNALTPAAEVTLSYNRTIERNGCLGALSPPQFVAGTAHLGNPAYVVGLTGAPAGAPCVLGLSTGSGFQPYTPCVIGLDYATLIWPDASGLGVTAADGAGSASFTFALPFAAAWAGATFRAQWLVLDPAGPASIGGLPFSVTDTRRVVLW